MHAFPVNIDEIYTFVNRKHCSSSKLIKKYCTNTSRIAINYVSQPVDF